MSDQYGNSEADLEHGDYLLEQKRDREMEAERMALPVHETPFVVFVPQIGGGKARPYFFTLLVFAEEFARETKGVLFQRATRLEE